MGQCKQDHHEILSSEYAIATRVLSINVFIPVQRGQTANCCCSKYLKSQLFINRMPKMCAIPQFVLAPLNPIPRNMQNILGGAAHNVSTVTDFHISFISRQVQFSIYRALSLNLDCMIMLISSFLEIDFEINISDNKSRRFDLSEVVFKCIKVL